MSRILRIAGLVLVGMATGLWITWPEVPETGPRRAVVVEALSAVPVQPVGRMHPEPTENVTLETPLTPLAEASMALATAEGQSLIRCRFPPESSPPNVPDMSFRADGDAWVGTVVEPTGGREVLTQLSITGGDPLGDVLLPRSNGWVVSWTGAFVGEWGTCTVSKPEPVEVVGRWVGPAAVKNPRFEGCQGVEAEGSTLRVSVLPGASCRVWGAEPGAPIVWEGTVWVAAGATFELEIVEVDRNRDPLAWLREQAQAPIEPDALAVALEAVEGAEAKAMVRDWMRERDDRQETLRELGFDKAAPEEARPEVAPVVDGEAFVPDGALGD